MGNSGQIFAYDADRTRLAPIYERLKRNGVRNAQVRAPGEGALDDLAGRMDRVVIDAPCTGTGTWRRRPDTKWKLTPELVAQRQAEQAALLAEAVRFLKPGGTIAYITCSILPEENDDQVAAFLAAHPGFAVRDIAAAWRQALGTDLPAGLATPAGGSASPRVAPAPMASISAFSAAPEALNRGLLLRVEAPKRKEPPMSTASIDTRTPRTWVALAVFLVLVIGVGGLIGTQSVPGAWYESLVKPPLNPPNWVFGPVWTALYIMIAIAGWRAFLREPTGVPMRFWAAQMLLNWAWSPVWFIGQMPGWPSSSSSPCGSPSSASSSPSAAATVSPPCSSCPISPGSPSPATSTSRSPSSTRPPGAGRWAPAAPASAPSLSPGSPASGRMPWR